MTTLQKGKPIINHVASHKLMLRLCHSLLQETKQKITYAILVLKSQRWEVMPEYVHYRWLGDHCRD